MFVRTHHLFQAPKGDGDDLGGGSEDRGDDFVPTDDEPEVKEPKAEAKEELEEDPKVKEGEEEGEEEPAKPKKGDSRMPISRHKQILEKERQARAELEQKLQQYEKGKAVAATNQEIKSLEDKVLELDQEYAELITDGKNAEALAKMREIRALERQIGDKKLEMTATATYAQATEKARYDIVVERLEAAYDVLNPDHDDFDPEQAQDVADLAVTYRNKGMTPADALQKAAKRLLGQSTKKQEQATEVTPRVDKEDAEAARRKLEADRRKAQVQKNVDASKRQPPDTSKIGKDSDAAGGGTVTAKDIMKMPYDDFIKLDEETLARARGDVLA